MEAYAKPCDPNKQKLYFLQHGVLALKNVDSLFSVDSSSSVDYFTASSEFEKNIIVNRMGYNPDKVPVTGLARWDGLRDTSDPAHANLAFLAGRSE